MATTTTDESAFSDEEKAQRRVVEVLESRVAA